MIARYPGKCARCGAPVTIGQDITWSRKQRGTVTHISCAPVIDNAWIDGNVLDVKEIFNGHGYSEAMKAIMDDAPKPTLVQ